MKKEEFVVRNAGRDYVSPSLTVIRLVVENVICESPYPSGNEGIGYEDWGNNN